MTTKTLTGTYTSGYALATGVTSITVASTGRILGPGVSAGSPATVNNDGTIAASGYDGVDLRSGGVVTNGSASVTTALITAGHYGVVANYAAATVSNYATIQAGVDGVELQAGGVLINGSTTDRTALVNGARYGVHARYAAASITNRGAITGGVAALDLNAGGRVVNGSIALTTASLIGHTSGVIGRYGAVTLDNFGIVKGVTQDGVVLEAGGAIANGDASSKRALIWGAVDGVYAIDHAVSVTNDATIIGIGSTGIQLMAGGSVGNGNTAVTTAIITGYFVGVYSGGRPALVSNFGTIVGTHSEGAQLMAGGAVTNGGQSDPGARITGYSDGVYAAIKSCNVNNFGTIEGATFDGVLLAGGGYVGNGGTVTPRSLISGYLNGVYGANRLSNVVNWGTIEGRRSSGVDLFAGGSVVNQATRGVVGLIKGVTGVYGGLNGPTTVTNYGTIEGTGGAAVVLRNSLDRLIAEAGSTWIGTVAGGGGALELANGVGTVTGLGIVGTLSGAEAMTFSAFGTYVVDAGASWTVTGTNHFKTPALLYDYGTLTNQGNLQCNANGIEVEAGGVLINTALMLVGQRGVYVNGASATVTNAGTIGAYGATSVILGWSSDRAVALSGSDWIGSVVGGGGTLELATGTGTITGLGQTATISGADAMTLSGFGAYVLDKGTSWTLVGSDAVGAGQTLSIGGGVNSTGALTVVGTVTGPGTLTVSGGTASILSGAVISVARLSATGGTTYINETFTLKGGLNEGSGAVLTIGAGDRVAVGGLTSLSGTLNGAGTLAVGNALVSGCLIGGTAILGVLGTVTQAGVVTVGDNLGDAAQVSILGTGVWNVGGGAILRGASAASKILSYGRIIETKGSAVGAVSVSVTDNGVVEAAAGTLDLMSTVFGTGSLKIDAGATLEVDAGATGALATSFNGGTATLALKSPNNFASTISGFAATDTIDLIGLAATSAAVGANDTLTILNGTRTVATLQLAGNYSGATFSVGADGHGGASVTLLPAASPMAFASAMAGFASGSAGPAAPAPASPSPAATLFAPRSPGA